MLTKSSSPLVPNLLDPIAELPLSGGVCSLVDPSALHDLLRYRWFVKQSHSRPYVVRRVRRGRSEKLIRLHRYLTNAPAGSHVHHRNGNTLDNRLSNLVVMDPQEHQLVHLSRFSS